MGCLEISRLVYPRSIFHLVSGTLCARSRTQVFSPFLSNWRLLDSGAFDILMLCAQQWKTIWKQEHSSKSWWCRSSIACRVRSLCWGGLLCCPFSEPLQHVVLLHKCAQLNITKVVCPVGFKHFWKQISSVILLGFVLSQSKWVAVLTIVLQTISINVRKWKQKAGMFPIINNTHDCLAQSPELEVIYLLLQCWRTFYKCPCVDRALDKPQR